LRIFAAKFIFMKKLLFLLLTACLMVSCSDPNARYVKKAIRIMDKHGLYAQGPEWEKAKEEALATQPASLEEAQQIVMKAGTVAGGKHTFLMTSDEVTGNDTCTTWEMPTVELLENGIAKIKLPQFMGNDDEGRKYAHTVLDALPNQLQGVVIDLRGNTGGNMYPMIAAVHRFLPNDVILKFKSRKRTTNINLTYVLQVADVKQQASINCPVALLTDKNTASSGEAVLICFRGLENTSTFGAPTAGYASCNQTFPLPQGSKLVLTTSEDVARTGEVFCDDPIEPNNPTETVLEDALQWIQDQIN